MIENIHLKSVATYPKTGISAKGFSKINFFYGANGSGKTTLSKFLYDPTSYSECSIDWKNGSEQAVLVYNRDFVERNFNTDTEIKGIFTLGEADQKITNEITSLKEEQSKLQSAATRLTENRTAKTSELEEVQTIFEKQAWDLKTKYDADFMAAFTGVRDKKVSFSRKLLNECETNDTEVTTFGVLRDKTKSVFGGKIEPHPPIPTVNLDQLTSIETSPVLQKRVLGRTDVDIAAMIERLGNSDWVKQGRLYYEQNNGDCPFCQQKTNDDFARSLTEYFDETYLKDMDSITDIRILYESQIKIIHAKILGILNMRSEHVDNESLKTALGTYEALTLLNREMILRKEKEPSSVVTLESFTELNVQITDIIKNATESVIRHNDVVKNIEVEREKLRDKIWAFIANEIRPIFKPFKVKVSDIQKAIKGLTDNLDANKAEEAELVLKLFALEKKVSSILPTINAINGLLTGFGFTGFMLSKSEKEGAYKLVRSDGTSAHQTLSEGERTFITFLYFYHMLRGSIQEGSITHDRVVVIDDPVSSLDSDILFIVSNLTKRLYEDVVKDRGYIKQLFILTHNIYFHKEITFLGNKSSVGNNKTYWVVRKRNNVSEITKYPSNPVLTSYELMWKDVRGSDHSNLTIQNTLRRIIEHYFKFLGNMDSDLILSKFTGADQLICSTLVAWMHSGSHDLPDDLYMTCDGAEVEKYLEVFKQIFYLTGHEGHYDMMIKPTHTEAANDDAIVATAQVSAGDTPR